MSKLLLTIEYIKIYRTIIHTLKYTTMKTKTENNTTIKTELSQSEMDSLKKQLSELQEKIKSSNEDLNKLKKNTVRMYNKIAKIDSLYLTDLTKVYGFNRDKMYYIGVASGRLYQKPIDDKIIKMITNLNDLSWQEVQFVNKHFISKGEKL